jgi:hypothetical protein
MNYKKFIKFLKEDFKKTNKNFTTIKFFRSEIVLILIWYWILEKYYKNEICISETIIQEIPREYASRPTIFKFLDVAISKGYIIKDINSDDKRKLSLTPSSQVIDEFENWANKFKRF